MVVPGQSQKLQLVINRNIKFDIIRTSNFYFEDHKCVFEITYSIFIRIFSPKSLSGFYYSVNLSVKSTCTWDPVMNFRPWWERIRHNMTMPINSYVIR